MTLVNANTGHGHVFPRPDGVKARCGGPALCRECAKDQARYLATFDEMPPVSKPAKSTIERMTRGKLIGLVGYKGSGKTTLTKEALRYLNHHEAFDAMPFIVHIGFSDPLIAMLRAMGIPSEILDNKERWNEPLEMLCGHSTRYACVTLGTEWGRDHIGQEVWTRIALKRADELRNSGKHVIIDNCRFPSEFDALREAGAVMVAFQRRDVDIDTTHESEKHIADLQWKCQRAFKNNYEFSESAEKWREMLLTILRE